jgi:4-hydroxythreonine-4-phosphate dehydrogenase
MPVEGSAPILLTMGEPAGVGPELAVAAWEMLGGHIGNRPLILVGDPAVFGATNAPVIPPTARACRNPGRPDPANAAAVTEAIAIAVDRCLKGEAGAMVTAPIHKAVLAQAGFAHPGHTEYLAALCANGEGTPQPVMMLAHEDLRVVPLTIHVPLREVPSLITQRLIRDTVVILEHDLRTRFGILDPKIAVTGLNPHAGESGSIGTEDRDIIAPAIGDLQHNGSRVEGPFSADTIFHPPNWKKYDAVVAMYHDQALIPIKTVAFDQGVNVTLGLPIVRTSPDHGTAFELAGTGQASIASMLAAIRLADRMTGGA